MNRHKFLYSVAGAVYQIPGAKSVTRAGARFALQRFPLSKKNKQRLYNFFAAPTQASLPLTCSVQIPNGRRLLLDLDLRDDLSRTWYWWGYRGYEAGTVRLLVQLLKPGSCFVDVGANIGYFTLLAGGLLEPDGRIYAFEPFPQAYHWLEHNLQQNQLSCVSIQNTAVSDSDGGKTLFLPSDGAWTNASLIAEFTEHSDSLAIKAIRLETFLAVQSNPHVDLIKIDVEGAELQVLAGMGEFLARDQPDLIIEVLPRFADGLNVFFADRCYRKFLITENGLEETKCLTPHPAYRDYYLSINPVTLI